jgi:hypothetical protein
MMHVDQIHPRVQAVNLETGELTPFFFKFLVKIWERTGGPNDFIDDALNDDTYESGTIDSNLVALEQRVQALELDRDMAVDSRIAVLQKRIEELELEVSMLFMPSLTPLLDRIAALETDVEMNYGA